MRKLTLVVAGALALGACGGEPRLETDADKAYYAMGTNVGKMLAGMDDDVNLDALVAGIRDRVEQGEGNLALTPEEMEAALQAFQARKQQEHQAKQEKLAQDNIAAGQAFREENAQKDGVEVLESGIQYEVLASGEEGAARPTLDDTVVAHYHGTLIDGTVFDSSVERGEPASFPLRRVIEGWQQALVEMKVGDKWRVVIPPELAYGERGAGERIGPNATLIFEIELLDVKKADEG